MNNTELNDHINGNPGGKGPATYCDHTVPYGPATGNEDPRAHETNDKPAASPAAPGPHRNSDQDPDHGPGMK